MEKFTPLAKFYIAAGSEGMENLTSGYIQDLTRMGIVGESFIANLLSGCHPKNHHHLIENLLKVTSMICPQLLSTNLPSVTFCLKTNHSRLQFAVFHR